PETAGVGTAKVTVALDAWKEGKVAPTRHELPVIAPKNPAVKLEPISPRLKRELVHPNRAGTLSGLRFSPGGKRLLAGGSCEGVVAVWDVATSKRLRTIQPGARGSCNCLVTPDWRTLCVPLRGQHKCQRVEKADKGLVRWTFDGCVRAWDLDTGR